jgi:hypothetical protein
VLEYLTILKEKEKANRRKYLYTYSMTMNIEASVIPLLEEMDKIFTDQVHV